MQNIIISLGGSVIAPDMIDSDYLTQFSTLIRKYANTHSIFIIVGGGKTARTYIKAARMVTKREYWLDTIGITVTRLNAMLVLSYFEDLAYPKIPTTIWDAVSAGKQYPIVVMGGTEPGHTTDTVAVLLAEALGCSRVINVTVVDGIFDKDPTQYKDAKLIPALNYVEAIELLQNNAIKAGPHMVLDLLSIKLAERSNIQINVLNGKNLTNLQNCIEKADFFGTVVK